MKIPRLSNPGGLAKIQVGGKVNNGVIDNRGCLLHLDLHTEKNNFSPTSTEGLSIPPALLFTKDQTQREGNNNLQRKVKTGSKLRV